MHQAESLEPESRSPRVSRNLLFLLSLVVLLIPENSGAQIKSIIIGESVRGAMYLPFYIAEEKNFFRKRDLETKIVTFSRSNDLNALIAGDIQFDLTAPDKVIHGALGGYPVKMVLGITRGLNLALAVNPAIKSAADLRGKSVAITGFSGLPYTGLLLCLKELGMTRDQVVPLNIGGKTARFEALLSGKVPAAILDPPYTTLAAKEGFRLLVDLAPLDVAYLRNIAAVSDRVARDDPRTVTRFVEAFAEGVRFYRNKANKDESMRVLAKYLRVSLDRNRPMVEEAYETYREVMAKKPYPDPAALKTVLDVVSESNPRAKSVNLASLVDSSYVEKLDREGYFDR